MLVASTRSGVCSICPPGPCACAALGSPVFCFCSRSSDRSRCRTARLLPLPGGGLTNPHRAAGCDLCPCFASSLSCMPRTTAQVWDTAAEPAILRARCTLVPAVVVEPAAFFLLGSWCSCHKHSSSHHPPHALVPLGSLLSLSYQSLRVLCIPAFAGGHNKLCRRGSGGSPCLGGSSITQLQPCNLSLTNFFVDLTGHADGYGDHTVQR